MTLKMLGKVIMITGASAGFGMFMGLLMSSFEHNSTMVVDTSRNTKS
jgi:NADP-dependent 3-hydroxy acid dehydrogenase YdfG